MINFFFTLIKSLFLFLLLLNPFFVNGQDNGRNPKGKSGFTPVSEVDLRQFTDFGFLFLKAADINFSGLPEKGETNESNFDYKKFVINQIINSNEFIIRKLVEKIDSKNSSQLDINLLRDQLLTELYPEYFKSTNTNSSRKSFKGIDTIDLFKKKKLTGVVLEAADIVDLYDVVVDGKVEKMVSLRGNVTVIFSGNTLSAKQVNINITTKNIYSEENVIIKVGENEIRGNNAFLNISDQYGYVYDAQGINQGHYFKGELFKFNDRNHFTLENGWITFSSNPDPYYRVGVGKFDSYGKDKSIYKNILVYVHNQPFVWIPYYVQYPVSTSLDVIIGENRREGYYLLTKTSFDTGVIDKLIMDFNIYEKLGIYFSLRNINRIFNSHYDLLVATAYYTENLNIRDKPNKLTYSYNTGIYLNSVSSIRHKVEYSHKFNLVDSKQKLVKSTLNFFLKNVSDPFITSNFPLKLQHLDLRKLIERHDKDESLYTASPSDKNRYTLKYNLSAPATSLAINLDWNYDIYRDLNSLDESIDKQYTMYLKTMTLPSINFSQSGKIDPYDAKINRLFFLNIGYQTSLAYSGVTTYKDGKPKSDGTAIEQTVDPYDMLKEKFHLKLKGSISKNFTIDKDKNSLWDLGLDWYDWNIANSLGVTYTKNWEGKNYTSSDNAKNDVSQYALAYTLSSGMGFNTSLATVFDLSINNSWTLTVGDLTYRYRPEDVAKFNITSLKTETYKSSYSFSIPIHFPSVKLKNLWNASYDYRSMLPTVTLNLISYTLTRSTSQEKVKEGKPYEFDIYDSRSLASGLSMQHRGYGLFYIPEFNYIFTSSVSLSYDLKPEKNESGEYISTSYFDDKDFWSDKRFKSFNGTTSWNFQYEIWKWNNNVAYDFFRTDYKKIDAILKTYSTSTTITYRNKNGKWVNLDELSLGYNWLYNFRAENYKKDSMSFSIATVLDVLTWFKVNLSFSSANSKSYRYFADKAGYLNEKKVNFFEDLIASLGILGVDKQKEGLFKMGSVKIGITHDLDDWQSSFSYNLVPVNYNKESLKGFYFDHRIQFQINLKPSKDPRGEEAGTSNPFFKKLDRDFTPEGFQ